MKTKMFELKRMTIDEFAEENGLTMEIHERSAIDSPTRFYANFEGAEISEYPGLVGAYGNGATPDEAVDNYAEEISGKLVVIGAYTDGRIEIPVPILMPLNRREK